MLIDNVARGRDAPIQVESHLWYEWLCESEGFTFEGASGHLTARRDLRQGSVYWYGYRRRGGKLSKVYLGKPDELTLERLERASALLAGNVTLAQLSSKSSLADLLEALKNPQTAAPDAAATANADRSFPSPTKLRPPALPQKLIARPRLTRRITTPVTFICAPSGFGKSTRLNEWQQTCGMPVAWVSLDADDNSPSIFWLGILTALQTIDPGFGQKLFPYLRAASPAMLTKAVLDFASEILNTPPAQMKSAPNIGLILDDYHHIHNPDIHSTLQVFLEQLPSKLQLVIGSQIKPPLDIGWPRTTGGMTEFDAEVYVLRWKKGSSSYHAIRTRDQWRTARCRRWSNALKDGSPG